ncbi:hypothetical protein [Chondromyces apiculatus]|uniref:Uncharacterized protein n=1 Tax=Chondromyces apiculatus DSM 436 TaxID=1192034 RepID=A0A017THQ9_9BACT|nr:hypothetical protein [Chondromyces apiculatus]EYF08789.1 Hypothetical protein CAP_2650 [Chondromyces apiculatus DSM 436]
MVARSSLSSSPRALSLSSSSRALRAFSARLLGAMLALGASGALDPSGASAEPAAAASAVAQRFPPTAPTAPAASIAPAASTAPPPWSAADPRIAAEVKAGKPLVISVIVPLCDGAMLDCGSKPAGLAGDLGRNLYWGAIFGQRRFLDRPKSGWEQVEVKAGEGPLLERAIYRRTGSQAPWGGSAEAPLEQLLVIQAVHGKSIDQAVAMFWSTATGGGEVRFQDGGKERVERIQVAGYAGHNRLMDRSAVPLTPALQAPVPAFVMACSSEAYFAAPLSAAGSAPLLTTRVLMAPEGYVVEAMARALGENAPLAGLRARVVDAYASWQRMPVAEARKVFAGGRFLTPPGS